MEVVELGAMLTARECAGVAIALDALERDLRRDGTRLPGYLRAVRDGTAAVAALARRKQAEVSETSPVEAAPVTLLTVADVAVRFRCSKANVGDLIRRHRLPARKVAGRWRVDVLDLELYQRERSA